VVSVETVKFIFKQQEFQQREFQAVETQETFSDGRDMAYHISIKLRPHQNAVHDTTQSPCYPA
jgi:hypothetical protein